MANKTIIKTKLVKLATISLAPLLLGGCAAANGSNVNVPNVMQMLQNIQNTLPSFWGLVAAFCLVTGLVMVIKALADLHIVAKMGGSMMGAQADPKGPLILLFMAAILLFMPTFLADTSNTFFGQNGPLAYQPIQQTGSDLAMSAIVNVIRFVGWCAFVRGWLVLSRHGHRNSQTPPGNFGKGMTHVIGGVLAANITIFWGALMTTVGMSST